MVPWEPVGGALCGGALVAVPFVAVPLRRLKMTKIKTLRVDGRVDGRTGGRTGGITLRGPRGPKKLTSAISMETMIDKIFPLNLGKV